MEMPDIIIGKAEGTLGEDTVTYVELRKHIQKLKISDGKEVEGVKSWDGKIILKEGLPKEIRGFLNGERLEAKLLKLKFKTGNESFEGDAYIGSMTFDKLNKDNIIYIPIIGTNEPVYSKS